MTNWLFITKGNQKFFDFWFKGRKHRLHLKTGRGGFSLPGWATKVAPTLLREARNSIVVLNTRCGRCWKFDVRPSSVKNGRLGRATRNPTEIVSPFVGFRFTLPNLHLLRSLLSRWGGEDKKPGPFPRAPSPPRGGEGGGEGELGQGDRPIAPTTFVSRMFDVHLFSLVGEGLTPSRAWVPKIQVSGCRPDWGGRGLTPPLVYCCQGFFIVFLL
jgi:hypothetical protein